MSKIYTYAIINSNNEATSAMRGLKGAPIYNIPYRDIGIVASDFQGELEGLDAGYALKHEEVVEGLMKYSTTLPMRLLTVFSERKDVLSMMEDYYDDFQNNLDRLQGKAEFGIRVIWPGEAVKKRLTDTYKEGRGILPVSMGTPGISYIKEKLKSYKIDRIFEEEADRCIAAIDNFFSSLASEKKLKKLESENLLLNASYLVENRRQAEFQEVFERLKKGFRPDLKYLFSGPWPAYNFVALKKKDGIDKWTKK